MEEEFIQNQERLKPQEEKQEASSLTYFTFLCVYPMSNRRSVAGFYDYQYELSHISRFQTFLVKSV